MIEGLSDRQGRFVWAFLLTEGNAKQSAELAGYGGGAAGMALRNLAKPKISKAIAERVKLNAGTALTMAMSRLLRIVEGSTDDRAAVAAAVALMDRFGMAPPRGPSVAVQINNSIGSHEAQGILADVQRARQMRLAQSSDIPPAMSDRSASEAAAAIDDLASAVGDRQGGVHLSGSLPAPVPITLSSSDGSVRGDVSRFSYDGPGTRVIENVPRKEARAGPGIEGMFD